MDERMRLAPAFSSSARFYAKPVTMRQRYYSAQRARPISFQLLVQRNVVQYSSCPKRSAPDMVECGRTERKLLLFLYPRVQCDWASRTLDAGCGAV